MKRSEYIDQITADAIEAARDLDLTGAADRDGLVELLHDELWADDSVTGNCSGSYTFNANEAARNVFGDADGRDLLMEAYAEFGVDLADAVLHPEAADVIIRCYLLGECLEEVADALEESGIWSPEE